MSEAPAAPVLEARDLVAGYEPGAPIVRGVSVAVGAGEIVAILGPNGAGKSTLVKAVAGLVPVASGCVWLGETEITRLPAHRMVKAGLGFVPQTENVFARMTVAENLGLAGARLTRTERRTRIEAMYALFPDLGEHRGRLAGRLSGGQRQMLAVARALLVEPRVLLLDEPSAGLAPRFLRVLLDWLRHARAEGLAVVLVEQNVRLALEVCDRAYLLVEGRQRLHAAAATLRDDPDVARLFFGGRRRP